MVNVRSIAEMGAYVHLLEYNNIEGMILLSELSRRRIRSINKLIRVGKTEPVVVIRVDKEKGNWRYFIGSNKKSTKKLYWINENQVQLVEKLNYLHKFSSLYNSLICNEIINHGF